MKSLASFLLLVLAFPTVAAAQDIANGNFENGTASWVKTSGFFNVVTDPNDSNNHLGQLRGASDMTSTIEQTVSGLTPAKYALAVFTHNLHSSCTTTATAISGGVTTSLSYDYTWTGFTLDFRVPSGNSTALIRISVTCTGLGRMNYYDDVALIWIGP